MEFHRQCCVSVPTWTCIFRTHACHVAWYVPCDPLCTTRPANAAIGFARGLWRCTESVVIRRTLRGSCFRAPTCTGKGGHRQPSTSTPARCRTAASRSAAARANHVRLAAASAAERPALQTLDAELADRIFRLVRTAGDELMDALLQAGVLVRVAHGTEPQTDLAAMRNSAAASPRLCSCSTFALRGQCEHTLFVEGLTLPGRPATRSFDTMVFPGTRQRGRPRGSVTARRAAAARRG